MPRHLPRFLLVLLTLCLGAGCDSGPENDFIGTTWVLDQLDLPPGDSTEATPTTIRFGSETQVAIDSCNDCAGGYRSEGHVLDFTMLVCTEIGCGNRLDLGPRLGTANRVVYLGRRAHPQR